MRKTLYSLILFFIPFTAVTAQNIKNDNAGAGNLKYIDPRIGNVGQLLQPTRPTVQLPNQLIRIYPQREDYIDDQISSFPLTIVSHRLGEVFSLKPSIKKLSAAAWHEKQAYDHDREVARPWYYSTYLLDDDITIECTPGKKTAIYRFTFPDNAANKSLLFGLYNKGDGSFSFSSGNVITGTETYHDNIKVYMYGEFSLPGKPGIIKNGQLSDVTAVQGKQVGSSISFTGDNSKVVEFRYAISYISPEQAKANFNEEIKGRSFNEIKDAAESAWTNVMDKIQVEGGTESQRRSFYTAYYRCNERMVAISMEDHKYFSGFDNKIHNTQRPFYVDDWIWDTYLALHPLRTILNPALEEDMDNSHTYPCMSREAGCPLSRYFLGIIPA